MKILITGAGGLVGTSLTNYCRSQGDLVLGYGHQALDITDVESVKRRIEESKPDVVVNCAAWTDVDGCELDHGRAFAVNARGPENLAAATAEAGVTFVTISTDYVFDGTKLGFYSEQDKPNPQSVYGVSKLKGEERARNANPQSIIVRSGFIFGHGGKNFLSTVIDRARSGQIVKAIVDARGTPTYANDLARRLRELALIGIPKIFHVVNSGEGATYVDFAKLAIRSAGLDESCVEPISTQSLHRPAARPANSCLACLVSESLGLAGLPNWQESTKAFATTVGLPESVARTHF